jgi:predicted aspartyl protease
MASAWWWVAGVCAGLVGIQASGQTGTAAVSAPARKTCVVNSAAPNAAETALNKKQYSEAEGLFRGMLAKDSSDEAAHEGLIRALIDQDSVDAAAQEATAWEAASPGSSMAMTAAGEVKLRQGSPRDAFVKFQVALKADLCNSRAYYGGARVDALAGLHASAKRLLEQAHALHPTDDAINTWWISTRPRKERMQMWATYAEHSDQISDEDRAKLKIRLEKDSLYHASDCRMAASSPRDAKVPMTPLTDGPRFIGWGLEVQFNGKKRRLQIDTGASGITISRSAAMSLGINREDATQMAGIGDKDKVKTSIAHVASVKIGGVEFTNCPVEILEKWSVLDSDGLIGGDVFDASLLTLDFPNHELRIAPLPPRLGETEADRNKAELVDDDAVIQAHDPYIAPGMEKWQRIYRSGHELLMPTILVETKRMSDTTAWKEKLFLLDTGSNLNIISPAAAREVTKVSREDGMEIRGIQGSVAKIYDAGKFTLAFASLRLDSPSMTAIDTTTISHDAGVEVSGLIGASALFRLTMHIDYRDNLVLLEYTPKK